jgi:hypothetical protein
VKRCTLISCLTFATEYIEIRFHIASRRNKPFMSDQSIQSMCIIVIWKNKKICLADGFIVSKDQSLSVQYIITSSSFLAWNNHFQSNGIFIVKWTENVGKSQHLLSGTADFNVERFIYSLCIRYNCRLVVVAVKLLSGRRRCLRAVQHKRERERMERKNCV